MMKKKKLFKKFIISFCVAILSIGILNATCVDETIQAEDYSLQSGCAVATNQAGYTGSGFLDYGGDGTWGEWTYVSPEAGTITLSVRYGNGSGDNRQCALTVNGSSEGNIAFVPSGGWTTWGVATVDIDVVEGTNTVRLTANTSYGGPNLDKLDLDGTVGGGGVDTVAPSIPTGLAEGIVTSASITINWTASTDNGCVSGYKVYINGSNPVSATDTSTTISELSASTQYSFTVSAFDVAGNESTQSAALNVTTDAPDSQNPSVPTGLAASGIYSTSFFLSWNASTDNVGVTGYEVFKDGASIGTTTQTTMYVGGLSATTTYSMTVKATDMAGNWSVQSVALNVTTSESSDDWPNEDNTGPSGTLTTYSGDITASIDSTIIENMDISGKVFVRANNVTIRNCKVSAVDVRDDYPYTGCLVEDCEMNWVGRAKMTIRRCKMRGHSVDLIRISGGDFLLEDCYLRVDGPKIEGAHADVIQSYPTATYNSIIRHNTLYAEDAVACINASDVTIENNLLIGGTYTIYGQRVKVMNNHFSTQLYANCGKNGLYYTGNAANYWLGNIWHETGVPALYPHANPPNEEEIEEEVVAVTDIEASDTLIELFVGDTFSLTAIVSPVDATDDSIIWSSLNTDIATIDQGGLITANAEGTALIIVTTHDNNFTDTCKVTIDKVSGVSVARLDGGINIYPNPLSSSILNIKLNSYRANMINVHIYDLTGRSVYNQMHSVQSELTIPVGNLSRGIYIISVNGNRQKLVIE